MTIAVTLAPDLERFVKQQVEKGRFTNADDVVRAALMLMQSDIEDDDLAAFGTLDEIKAKIAVAEADPRRLSATEVREAMAAHHADWIRKNGQ